MKNLSFKAISKSLAVLGVLLTIGLGGCESYLDLPESAFLNDDDVFGTYEDFQGFEDNMYRRVIPYLTYSITASLNWGDDVVNNRTFPPSGAVDIGDYWYFWNNTLQNILVKNGDDIGGVWNGSWSGIRIANLCLQKLDEGFPQQATAEQKNLLRGQALFFRAWFHQELIRFYGGMPYVDVVFSPQDELRLDRLSFQATTDRIVDDYDAAIPLLPESWDIVTGYGRVTKGAAYAFKAKALLYAGSPLMNNEVGNGFTFNQTHMEAAAEAASQVINLANQGVYRLLSWPEYSDNFHKNNGDLLGSDEIIFSPVVPQAGKARMSTFHGRVFNNSRWEGNNVMEAPTANYVELFEMANGLPTSDPASGYDPSNPWVNRDPRFDYNLLLDGTKWADGGNENTNFVQLYLGGGDRGTGGSLTGYMIKKYWPRGVNRLDNNWNNFRFGQAHMRLADVYLIYAEAVNEVWGPTTPPPFSSLTAVDAINIVRNRAGMPNVDSKFTGSKEVFRDRIWNERAVELAFEGSRWFDIRRWHVAHLKEYKELFGLEFDKDKTFFRRTLVINRVFDERHYWIPIDRNQSQLYEGFNQNPGW
ncbi:MAG: RagB/SusD family nutrient uptake outer membrane protein [Bacteroidia bacterium]|nr:RagB/SusD family nutrient uptake outer membrane protein [Bacteroidia bacterium]